MDEKDYRLVKIFSALGNGVRFQIARLLLDSARTVSEIAETLDRSVSSISHHLRTLRDVDLVQAETAGQSRKYEAKRPKILRNLLSHRDDVRRE